MYIYIYYVFCIALRIYKLLFCYAPRCCIMTNKLPCYLPGPYLAISNVLFSLQQFKIPKDRKRGVVAVYTDAGVTLPDGGV